MHPLLLRLCVFAPLRLCVKFPRWCLAALENLWLNSLACGLSALRSLLSFVAIRFDSVLSVRLLLKVSISVSHLCKFVKSVVKIIPSLLFAALLFPSPTRADEIPPGTRTVATNQIDGVDVATALRRFTVPRGFKVDLFAAEPDVQNPVSLAFDAHGRLYVVESHRRRSSVFDIRNHKDWLETDFSFRTVEDRANFFKWVALSEEKPARPQPHPAPRNGVSDWNGDGLIDWRDLEVESERIRILEDTDGSGHANKVTVFADDFKSLVSGVAAGILVRRNDVYFTCIPDLWKLHAPDGGGPADQRSKLLGGFGVHIALGGHDMHGLIFGPDGRLYWSIADRGTSTNLLSQLIKSFPGLTGETLADAGAVFRCNPDGSEFEIFATGLRNPQELAFDEYGNLFTDDNNGDFGDPARWHYVVKGADHGWRMGWQWLPKMGAWNSEKIWACPPTNNSASIVPPLAHIANGPAGLAYNPGTGLPSAYYKHFFLCDFPIDVLTWTNKPKGAYFETGPVTRFFGQLGPSDVTFGVEGGVYVSDWTKTFEKTGKGRIYRVHDPITDQSDAVQKTKSLLARGTTEVSANELIALFSYPDMRIRQDAQFELAERAATALAMPTSSAAAIQPAEELASLAINATNQLTRIHALWAFAQVRRAQGRASASRRAAGAAGPQEGWASPSLASRGAAGPPLPFPLLRPLAHDPDPELRAQYANFLGECPSEPPDLLAHLVQGSNARVRFFAAQSLGSLGRPESTPALLALLRSNNDEDPFIRHAAVFALALIHDVPTLIAAANDPSPAVRTGILLALRRWQNPEVARFLRDRDPKIVIEAARAINDMPIISCIPELAQMLDANSIDPASDSGKFTLRRALNANFRLGLPENANAISQFAAKTTTPDVLRVEALEMLADWPEPPRRDKIVGLSRPLPRRDARVAADALRPTIPVLLRATNGEIRIAAIHAATALRLNEIDFYSLLADTNESANVRIEALKSLGEGNDPRLADAVKIAASDQNSKIRSEAAKLLGQSAGDLTALAATLQSGSLDEQRSAIASISKISGAVADDLLVGQLDRLLTGKLARELVLDILDSAEKRNAPSVKTKLAEYEAGLPKNDPLAPYRAALYGGNAEEGRKVFIERQDAGCFRCHKINGEGGAVGPDLTGLGHRQPREYILESIVFPNKQIAPGFENAVITLKNGATYAGVVKSANDQELILNSGEDGEMKIRIVDIASRQRGLSAMPEGLAGTLSKSDLRNLVEFLAR